jgi:imidazoleglycerol-phosphate dehydratase
VVLVALATVKDFYTLADFPRRAQITRHTKETRITLSLQLDAPLPNQLETDLPFLTHMLNTFACHGQFGLQITAQGDVDVDPHHLIEDTGIVLGQAIKQACGGEYGGILRAGHFRYPMDGTLADVALDLCGRPNLQWHVPWLGRMVGTVDPQLFSEFFKGCVDHAGLTLHVDVLRLDNDHHGIEATFKAFTKALRMAVTPTQGLLSTKGQL